MTSAAKAWAKVDAIAGQLALEIVKSRASGRLSDAAIAEIIDGAAAQLRDAAGRMKPGDHDFADRIETAFRAHIMKAATDLSLHMADPPQSIN